MYDMYIVQLMYPVCIYVCMYVACAGSPEEADDAVQAAGVHALPDRVPQCLQRHQILPRKTHTYMRVEKIFKIFGMYECMCGSVVQWFAARVVFVSAFSKSFPAQ